MSIYRRLIVAVAAMGLATSVFAADEATTTTDTNTAAPTETAQAASNEAAPSSAEAAPAPSAEAATTEANNTAAAGTEKLDVNKASAKDLMKLKGISAAKAKAIVTFRKKHGDFKSLDDLKEVKGFKKLNEKKLQEIQEQLTIG